MNRWIKLLLGNIAYHSSGDINETLIVIDLPCDMGDFTKLPQTPTTKWNL